MVLRVGRIKNKISLGLEFGKERISYKNRDGKRRFFYYFAFDVLFFYLVIGFISFCVKTGVQQPVVCQFVQSRNFTHFSEESSAKLFETCVKIKLQSRNNVVGCGICEHN